MLFNDDEFDASSHNFGNTEYAEDTAASTSDVRVLRMNISDPASAEEWMQQYKAATNTSWIVKYNQTNCTKMVYHKVWYCQHSKRNKTAAGRNTDCQARVDIKIKKVNKGTKRNDEFLRKAVPLPAVVKLNEKHNHSTESADALRLLRASPETRSAFSGYFEEGMTPAEAIQHHEQLLSIKPDGPFLLANGSINPNRKSVYSWHQEWRKAKYGPAGNPVAKLLEKVDEYTAGGADVSACETSDGDWAALVITPIMRRAQTLESAQNIIFVDSTSLCDGDGNTVTILLTATKAGAVPVAVLIHRGQSREDYRLAFELLKQKYPKCFGNNEAPGAFMSDNDRAEKDALRDVWPSARQLLCHFRVLQAEWRWLKSAQNNIGKEERRQLMAAFQKILYAKDEHELETAIAELQSIPHMPYVQRVNMFLSRQCEWVLLYRAGVLARGQNINNYSEASVRILKDVILNRTKAYNAVALIEFVITNWEEYFETRLLHHAHNREPSHQIGYEHLLQKMPEFPPKSIVVEQNCYYVPNSSGTGTYKVLADIGLCSCTTGRQGAFCKHQAAVQQAFGGAFPNSPELTAADCIELGQLALGEHCTAAGFFMPLTAHDAAVAPSSEHEAEPSTSYNEGGQEERTSSTEPETQDLGQIHLDHKEVCAAFNEAYQHAHGLGESIPEYAAVVKSITEDLLKLNTSSAVFEYMLRQKAIGRAMRHGKKIQVQPTSLARRRPGRPRTAGKIRKTKHGHVLSQSVRDDVPGAKCH
ncbi:uncharacterized protein LOC119449196 [Dermacentor silvarum]|uniref:uncharacterized protein LOC119449196 n=1 Tax=Dermacentor silvarum TaxID=543639 RepID=UPI002101BD16|nr:uncharacterized protein LOC119449196 [Dermacentor silvarum]